MLIGQKFIPGFNSADSVVMLYLVHFHCKQFELDHNCLINSLIYRRYYVLYVYVDYVSVKLCFTLYHCIYFVCLIV